MGDTQNKKLNNWLIHVKSEVEKNPGVKYRDLLVIAKKTYVRPTKETKKKNDNTISSNEDTKEQSLPTNESKPTKVKRSTRNIVKSPASDSLKKHRRVYKSRRMKVPPPE